MQNLQETLNKLAQDFISRLNLPDKKSPSPFLVATIGLVGSGRTTAARKIAGQINGAVLVQANSARFLLKEAGLPWGGNVRIVLKQVSKDLLLRGYGVVFDGNASDEEDRKNIEEIAADSGARIFYVRLVVSPGVAKEREKEKYDNPDWASSFEDFRVNATEKMLKNIDDRVEVHKELQTSSIRGIIGEIDNSGVLEELNRQADQMAEKIKRLLQ